MNTLFLVLSMIFCHIVDDYYLQGWLASAKQKKYWQYNAPDKMYRYDYIWALLMHSFSWSFMVMLPIALSLSFDVNVLFGMVFVSNVAIHAFTDNLKANKKKTNLWVEQIIHLTQIFIKAIIFIL